jgi:LmbE family N-acetylglucosaminyl deacetylase
MVFDAVFAAKNKYVYSREPWKVDKIFFFGSNKPNYYEDITNKFELKLKALSMHKSQYTDFSKVKKIVIEKISQSTKKYKFSEAFRVVKVEQLV